MREELIFSPNRLLTWLMEDALPFWAVHGVDYENGGYFEKLDASGAPLEEMRRARLISRQIYCFATAYELGWQGPADEIVHHGLYYLTSKLIEDDGTVNMAVSSDGLIVNRGYDPYDYAFVLFALAAASRKLASRNEMLKIALRVRERLVTHWSHPEVGFEEGTPRKLPLKANSHMHLFESFLAWAELVGDQDHSWQSYADQIAQMAIQKFVSPKTGAISEFFDGSWRALSDVKSQVVEPGHQFEWSWLLARWCRGGNDKVVFNVALRLAQIGEDYGVDAVRGVAINSLDGCLELRDGQARLWPQTERIKAWHELSRHELSSPYVHEMASSRLLRATQGLGKYIVDIPPGLWNEAMDLDGEFIDQPVRASSLYHIVCAAHTLDKVSMPVR